MFSARSQAAGELPAGPVPYFAPLDVVRFVAATMILIIHSYDHWVDTPAIQALIVDAAGQPRWLAVKLRQFEANFFVGVDIFFLLSGFLITYLLLLEKERNGRIDLPAFYVRRILRIWPLYYISVAMAPVLTHFYNEPGANLFKHIFFLGNFSLMHHGWSSTAVNHLWSICIEEHFYLVWPLIVMLVPIRQLPKVFALVIATSLLVRLYYFWFVQWSWMQQYLNTFCRWDLLACGALLAWAYHQRVTLPRIPTFIRWLVYCLTLLIFANDVYTGWDDVFMVAFKKYLYMGVMAFALGNLLFNPDSVLRWRKPTIFHYFGKISYGIYMYHSFVIFFLLKEFPAAHNAFFVVWVMLITLAVSALSYEFIEKPILRLKKHFDAFRRKPVPAPVTA